MKKSTLFIAAAALMFAGCASDDLTPGANVNAGGASSTIGFGFNVPNQTRGTLSGKAAADKLDSEFVVYGTKHTAAEDGTDGNDAVVFQNYKVQYTENSANTTETNTHNWEYNGLSPYDKDHVAPALAQTQTVKYWDYSAANGYTFTAFSAKKGFEAGSVETVTKLTTGTDKYQKGYKVSLKKDAKLDNIFYSDRVEVEKDNYGSPVVLTFRNFGTRVRVGFYETVPGYSVKIDNFYFDDGTSTPATPVTDFANMTKASTDAFKAASYHVAQDPGTNTNNELTVTYQANGNVVNQPTVANTTCTYENTLTLGGGVVGTELGTSSTSPTWDTNGDYTTVYPNEACANPMLIRCDYTLTSTDGSNEKITVKNARVVVPAEYLKWKPNFAYTYLFKISDKTNGTTGDDSSNDPEGLHPITFDAVVVDAATGNQETVSGLTTNSVTTYANGSQVTANGEYKSGEDIYVVNQSTTGTHEVIDPKGIGDAATNAQVYELSQAATEGEVYAQLNGAKLTGLTMNAVNPAATQVTTIPLSDGTSLTINAVKFTPTVTGTAKCFAYVYTNTKYVAPDYEQVATTATYSDITTYYFKTTSGVYYTASGIDKDNFDTYKNNSALYTQTNAGTPGVYDIKVITVKP